MKPILLLHKVLLVPPSNILVTTFLLLLISTTAGGVDAHEDGNASSSSHSEKPNLGDRSLILVKLWCLIVVFVGTFLAGISSYFMKWNEELLVLGTQFAGGVFLGTAMMHFLSDSNDKFKDLTSKTYPFAFMLACAGYLLTMLADSIVSYVYGKRTIPSNVTADFERQEHVQNEKKVGDNEKSLPSPKFQGHGSHNHFVNDLTSTASSLGDSILLIVALCFHSVFEGITIGVAETKSDAWKALWIISLHKIFAAIAMGIALLRMIPDRPLLSCVAYAFAFAGSSPIGVAVGIVLDATTQGAVADWIYAISVGIACGVFIFVSINRLLSKGYVPLKAVAVDTSCYKFLAVLLGIGVIAVVMIWDS